MASVQQFSNKAFDTSVDPLIKGLKECFGLSTKASFVFLAAYGMKYPERVDFSKRVSFEAKGRGSEWRDDTDNETLGPAVDILIERQAKKDNLTFQQVRTDAALLKKVTDELMAIATCTALTMLNGELASFKHGVAQTNKQDFIIIVSGYFKELAESPEPF